MTESIQYKIADRILNIPIGCFLGGLFIISMALRLLNLEGTGLWMDEIHSAVGSDPDKTIKEVLQYCTRDQPPVFFLLLHGWFKIFTYSDFSGRLMVAITGGLGVVAMYFAGKEFKNYKVGLFVAFLTMINYLHVDFSRQMRFYPLVFLLSALSFLFYLRIFKTRSGRDFVFYILSTAALLNTHYFGMVVFASQFIIFAFIIFWYKITDYKFIIYSLVSGLAVAFSFVHWLPVVFSDLGISQFHVEPIKWYFPATYHWVYFRDAITAVIVAILILRSIWEIYLKIRSRAIEISEVVLLGWVGLGFLIPVVYSIVRMPMLEYKYSIIVLPGIFIFAGLGFDSLQIQKLRSSLPVILLVAFLINSFLINPLFFRKPFEEWREVTSEIKEEHNKGEIVFTNYAWYYNYYFKVYDLSGQPYEPRISNFNAMVDQFNSVWILTQTRYPDPGLTPEQEEYLTTHFKLVSQKTFADSVAKRYVRR